MSARSFAAALLLAAALPAVSLAQAPGAASTRSVDGDRIDAGIDGQALPAAGQLLAPGATTRSGRDIYARFREGLADPKCEPGASARWRQHFAHAPAQLASTRNDTLALFGYVVDALREAHLPTEYALIPFVESGYRPAARSPSGPAGLWQFIAVTARNHKVPVQSGYDGRLSPVDSTTAAVRYLKTLHGMFAGDWRLAVMAYNAGEFRVLGALRRSGQRPADADPETLGLPAITHAYVRKLHALSCIFEEVEDREAWLASLERPVPILMPSPVPAGTASLDALAAQHGADLAQLQRLNPALAGARLPRGVPVLQVLAPSGGTAVAGAPAGPSASPAPASARDPADLGDAMADASAYRPPARTHTVARGDSLWRIAQRYGVSSEALLALNRLDPRGVLRPGMVLAIDTPAQGSASGGVAE